MSYKWEDFTAYDFSTAVTECNGTCIVPLGVIEKHGPHLPLGTDMFQASRIAELASEIEPAMIFPPYYFTLIHEAKPQPGTIAIKSELVSALLENICEEIYRNGFKKIILLNGHGGNCAFLRHFVSTMMLEKKRDYNLYLAGLDRYFSSALNDERYLPLRKETSGGHAGEAETSLMLAINDDLVKMDELDKNPDNCTDMKRTENLRGNVVIPGLEWYASYPFHYAGEGKFGTAEKGKILLEVMSEKVAEIIRTVKNDTSTEKIKKEFFELSKH